LSYGRRIRRPRSQVHTSRLRLARRLISPHGTPNKYANTWGLPGSSDGNTSIPVAITNNTGGVAPTATIPATSQADDLIPGYTAYLRSGISRCCGAGYTANNSFQGTLPSLMYNTQGAISKSVSATQSSLTVSFGNAPNSPAGFFMIADALTNDLPPAKTVPRAPRLH